MVVRLLVTDTIDGNFVKHADNVIYNCRLCCCCGVLELVEQFCAYDVQGMCTPLISTTIVYIERLFNSDTATMSWTFTVFSIGYFAGAVACGFIFDRVNHELLLVVVNFIEAAATIVAPFSTTLPLFIAALFIQANTQGFLNASRVWFLS